MGNKLNKQQTTLKSSPLDQAGFITEPIYFSFPDQTALFPKHYQNNQQQSQTKDLPSHSQQTNADSINTPCKPQKTFKTQNFNISQNPQHTKLRKNQTYNQEILQNSHYLLMRHSHIFQDLYEGFKLWEGGIVMSRFMLQNPKIFFNKSILELGAGIGVCGLVACKYLQPTYVLMTDYLPEVMELLQENVLLNTEQLQTQPDIGVLDWNQPQNFSKQYEVILGSELVYSITNCENLAQLACGYLKQGGKLIMMIPTCRAYGNQFFEALERINAFEREDMILDSQQLHLFSPIPEFYQQQKLEFQEQQKLINNQNNQETNQESNSEKEVQAVDKKIDEMTYSVNCKDPFYPLRNLTFRLIILTKL